MKHSTLLALALFAASTMAIGQSQNNHETIKSMLSKTKIERVKNHENALKRLKKKTSDPIYKHYQDSVLLYNKTTQEWELSSTGVLDWDKRGNQTYSFDTFADGHYEKVLLEYDDNDEITLEHYMRSEDGVNFKDSIKTVYVYDEKTGKEIGRTQYKWVDGSGLEPVWGYNIEVTRNEAGSVTEWNLVDLDGSVEEQGIVTYGSDGKATEIKFLMLNEETSQLEEDCTYTNMEWDSTSGQFFSIGKVFYTTYNQLKSTDITLGGNKIGAISVTYDTNGGYTWTETYTQGETGKYVGVMTYTDENGSFSNEYFSYASDGTTLTETDKEEYIYDSHGNEVAYKYYKNDKYLWGNFKDYEYDDTYGYRLSETAYSENNSTGTKYYGQKKFFKDYRDVTPVELVSADSADDTETVYTVGGVKVGNSLNNQPKGLYVVKKGTKTTKVVKR